MVTLATVREAIGEYAASLDPSRVSCAEAARLLEQAAAIEAAAASVKVRLAARVAESDVWRAKGALSPAHFLAQTTGESIGRAKQDLATGQRMSELPLLASAAARGELSATKQAVIADAAAAAPGKERHLVRLARRRSVGELREEAARVKAAAEPDLEARRARIHANRGMRKFTDTDGVGHLNITDNPEKIAHFTAHFAPERERLFQSARAAGMTASSEALDWDAAYNTVCGTSETTTADTKPPRRVKVDYKVIVRVDYQTLLRGHPVDGEVCEIAGVGPIAVSAVREILDRGGFLAAVVTQAKPVHGVAHLGRGLTAKQRTAYEWHATSCSAEGCNRNRNLEGDHPWGREFVKTGHTSTDELDPLCGPCHDLKTYQHWALVEGTGKRPLVPPDDPRHPRWKQVTA